jgi:hypothetical protein
MVNDPRSANRVVCYCKDCQAFAHFLDRVNDVLDERGGSDIVQIMPKNVTFTQGTDSLACMRLTPKGLLRWYAVCCKTPIGNTLHTPKLSFVGLVHTCLEQGSQSLDESFGPVRVVVNTQSAKGEPKPKQAGLGKMVGWFFGNALKGRFNGDYKKTPFFRADGSPIVTPHILSSEEHERVMRAVLA